MCCCMIETSSVPHRKSIFGNFRQSSENVRKMFGNVRLAFRNNFGKSSEIFGKWSEIFGKSSSLVCLYNKQNITCPLVDMNFIFVFNSISHSFAALTEHSKIKFISMGGHVIILYVRSAISNPRQHADRRSFPDRENQVAVPASTRHHHVFST